MTGREKLTKWDFNYINLKEQPDGSVEVFLYKRGEAVKYHLVVKNLFQPNEQVISDEELSV